MVPRLNRAGAIVLAFLATLAAAHVADRVAFGLAMCRHGLAENCPAPIEGDDR